MFQNRIREKFHAIPVCSHIWLQVVNEQTHTHTRIGGRTPGINGKCQSDLIKEYASFVLDICQNCDPNQQDLLQRVGFAVACIREGCRHSYLGTCLWKRSYIILWYIIGSVGVKLGRTTLDAQKSKYHVHHDSYDFLQKLYMSPLFILKMSKKIFAQRYIFAFIKLCLVKNPGSASDLDGVFVI